MHSILLLGGLGMPLGGKLEVMRMNLEVILTEYVTLVLQATCTMIYII